MGLKDYFKKRRFKETPEPEGAVRKPAGKKLAFVIQEHHATALHYDFRLEVDGVLKSWAIPKGPSLDPHEHHLAIQTEDHPYEYRTFEGVIPEGNYGAGNVIIWDQGWYQARAGDPEDSEKTMRLGLKKGHLTFVLNGKKLKGEFALIKMLNAKEKNAWLLVKKGDEYASSADVTKQDESVKSHHRVDDLGASNKLPDLSAYSKAVKPWHVTPMFCLLFDQPFSHDNWLFEVKWDGYRAIATKHKDDIQLYSRNGLDFSSRYRPVAEALRGLKHDVILDGEVVVVDPSGKPHFEWLQGFKEKQQGELRYYAFDILWCDGRDLRTMPLRERKKILQSVVPASSILYYSDHVEGAGEKLFAKLRQQGMEGMVAKQKNAIYREGVRGNTWLKIKTGERQEVVIGGYTEPRGGRKYIGSLLVGVYDKGNFICVGHSGGGIPDTERKALLTALQKIEQPTTPFAVKPAPNAPVHWVKPKLVCEMSFSEWTEEGYMRHPKFEGMRTDKSPTEVHKETSFKHVKVRPLKSGPAPEVEFTHLTKVFFPKHKYVKGDLIKYYESIADYILPYIKDRPCSMNRMPNGITGQSFYQKNNEHLPDWVPHTDIFSDSNNANLRWIVGGDLPTLLYMVQLGCIEINPWNSRVQKLERPDWAVIDLDPEGIGFDKVIEVARTVKKVCDEWKIAAYPKTSGKTGLHMYIPLGAKYSHEQAKNVAHLIALEVNKRLPNITSVERLPEKRKHKIYIDFLQNREGQTLAAPYSVRPTPDASVSMPLHWDEVKPGLTPTDFTIKNAKRRLAATHDLWKPVLGEGIDLTAILKHIEN